MKQILIPSGIEPVHSFDLWGTLVIQEVLGPRVLDAFQELMTGKDTPEIIAQKIVSYQGVLKGDKEALRHKKKHVDAVEDPLWPAYLRGEVDVDFKGTLYQDTLDVMGQIAEAGEGLCILTTGKSPWVKKALMSIDSRIGRTLSDVYSGDKSSPEVYEATAEDLKRKQAQMVSHTEDQMKGFEGILQSELKKQVELIYIERADLATADEVLSQGIDHHVTDLTKMSYIRR
jgi:phosphoglycolate phosphatase-like HAD superfamily hydrolase